MRTPFSTKFLLAPSSAISFLALLSSFLLVSTQNITDKEICQTKECLSAAQNLKESIDFSADPCDDFYKYACGNWPYVHPCDDCSKDAFSLRDDENMEEILGFLKQNNTEGEPEAVHKARQFFSLCMNEAAYSKTMDPVYNMTQTLGLPTIWYLDYYSGIQYYDYTTVLAKASKLAGINVYFILGTYSNPFNQTENMITLAKSEDKSAADHTTLSPSSISSGPRTVPGKTSDHQFLARIKRSTSAESTESFKAKVDELNNKTKEHFQELKQIREKPSPAFSYSQYVPVIYTLKQLQNLTDGIAVEANTIIPKLNWTRYIEEMYTGLDNVTLDLSDPTKVNIAIYDLEYIKEVTHLIYKWQSVEQFVYALWKNVLYSLLRYYKYVYYLPYYEIEAPTESYCLKKTIESLDMAVSYVYTTKKKYNKAKIVMGEMFDRIRDSFNQTLQKANWLDDTTKIRALKKLQSMKARIAYPDMIKSPTELNNSYEYVQIFNNIYDTIISRIQKDQISSLNQLNQINELSKDDFNNESPSTVNAFQDYATNTIIIPAGILGSPMYTDSLRALDYGAIGSTVGHEMSHAFDNAGRRFNEIGNLENWWTNETSNLYREKAKCFVEAYSNYSTTTGNVTQKRDSRITLAEDISDNGGFKQSLLAYRKYVSELGKEPILPQFENFTHEQLFTLAFANRRCENPTTFSARWNQFDTHSPSGVRVNGVLLNSKEFAEIWKCPKGSRMNPNNEKCSVW